MMIALIGTEFMAWALHLFVEAGIALHRRQTSASLALTSDCRPNADARTPPEKRDPRYATRRSPTIPGRLGTRTDFGGVRPNQRSYAVQRSGVEVCLGSNPAVSPGDGRCRRSVRGPDPPHGKPSPPPAEGEPPGILSASVSQPSGRWSTRKQQTARTRPRQSPNQSTPTNWPMCARVR